MGMQTVSRAASVRDGVSALAELFGLSKVLNTPVDQISGGQRRRVSLAETLATQPKYGYLPVSTDSAQGSQSTDFFALITQLPGSTLRLRSDSHRSSVRT